MGQAYRLNDRKTEAWPAQIGKTRSLVTCLSKQLENQKRDGKPGLAQCTKWKD